MPKVLALGSWRVRASAATMRQPIKVAFSILSVSSAANVKLFKDARLAALLDAPDVFGERQHHEEIGKPDDYWEAPFKQPGRAVVVVATSEDAPAGMAIGFERDESTSGIGSVWVRADLRGRRVGLELLTPILDWARERRHDSITLWNNDDNAGAARFYERLGFVESGASKPNPHRAGVTCLEMKVKL